MILIEATSFRDLYININHFMLVAEETSSRYLIKSYSHQRVSTNLIGSTLLGPKDIFPERLLPKVRETKWKNRYLPALKDMEQTKVLLNQLVQRRAFGSVCLPFTKPYVIKKHMSRGGQCLIAAQFNIAKGQYHSVNFFFRASSIASTLMCDLVFLSRYIIQDLIPYEKQHKIIYNFHFPYLFLRTIQLCELSKLGVEWWHWKYISKEVKKSLVKIVLPLLKTNQLPNQKYKSTYRACTYWLKWFNSIDNIQRQDFLNWLET